MLSHWGPGSGHVNGHTIDRSVRAVKRLLINLVVCAAIIMTGVVFTVGVVLARRVPYAPEMRVERSVAVSIRILEGGDISDLFTLTGNLEPWKEVLLSAETSGLIEWQGVEAGDLVAAGEELLRIDRTSTELRLDRARAQYNLSLYELERIIKLHMLGINSPQEMERARADRDVTHANMRALEVDLSNCTVRASFDGVVERVYQERDEYVSVGTPLLNLIQVHKLKMVVGVADKDIPHIAAGDVVQVRVDAYKDKVYTGRVHRLAVRAEESTHTFETEIEVDNFDNELKAGMIGSAVLVRNTYPGAISVPIFSVMAEGAERYVFVEHDGHALKRPVSISFYQGNVAVIGDGLAAGDRLIVAGHRNLRDGSAVTDRE